MLGTQIFYNGQQACLNSAPDGGITLLILHSDSALAQQKDIIFFQDCSLYKHPWKIEPIPLFLRCAEMWYTHEDLSLNNFG